MTTENTANAAIESFGALAIGRDGGWYIFTIGGESLRWDRGSYRAFEQLNEWLSPRGVYTFLAESSHSYFYGWYKQLENIVEVVGQSRFIDLDNNHYFVGGGRSSNDSSRRLVLVSNGEVTVTHKYEDNGNGDRPQGRTVWTVTVWEVKGGVATQKAHTDLQAPIEAAARKQFARDIARRLITLGFSRNDAWDIIHVSGPAVVPQAFNMAFIWTAEFGSQRISLQEILGLCLRMGRMPGEDRFDRDENVVKNDLDMVLTMSGLSAPVVDKYGMMFAVVRTAIKMLDIGLPDPRPVDAV